MLFRRAIVKRVHPFIPGNFEATVITFEKTMMHLVVEGTQCEALLAIDHYSLVAGMGGRRGQREVLQMENNQQRIGRTTQ